MKSICYCLFSEAALPKAPIWEAYGKHRREKRRSRSASALMQMRPQRQQHRHCADLTIDSATASAGSCFAPAPACPSARLSRPCGAVQARGVSGGPLQDLPERQDGRRPHPQCAGSVVGASKSAKPLASPRWSRRDKNSFAGGRGAGRGGVNCDRVGAFMFARIAQAIF